MRIGIYNHQHQRGGCPGCSQNYVRGMIADAMKCKNRAIGIYGEDCEFFNYTDLGDYPSDNLNRPGFKRMMNDIASGKLDVIAVITLDKISTNIDLLLETYKTIRSYNLKFITANEGEKAMEILDKALVKWGKKQK
ncbi:MAG: recombinase family protein [Eubacterium sp.]|nr:recombinase family protein [Eubacterium sp.]MDD7208977.1 recombinase family protein [Lachnospiraceae bacterium]